MRLAGSLLALSTQVAIILGTGAVAAQELKVPQITIRATSALPDSVIKYIADISEPQKRTMPAGVKPEAFLAAACGGALTNTYQEKFYELNSRLERTTSNRPREVMVPGCAQWRKDAVVPVRQDDTLDALVKREIGAETNAILRQCAEGEKSSRCDRSIGDIVQSINPGVDVKNLKPGGLIKLPVVSKFTTVALKQGELSPEQATATIAALTAEAIPTSAAQPLLNAGPAVDDIELIAPLSFESPQTAAPNCRNADHESQDPWPIDVDRTIEALERNRKLFEASSGQQIRSTRVAVLDTGLLVPTQALPARFFEKNVADLPDNNKDDDNNGFTDDHYGIDARGFGKIVPHAGYGFRLHGWYVADLVTGGSRFREKFTSLHQHVRLKIIHLVSVDGDKFEIKEGALLRGLQYAARYVDIANVSVGSPTKMDNVVTMVQSQPQLLLIVAAGNEGKDLNLKATYPALFGGDHGRLKDQVITVSAHRADGERADFSNFSADYADIAAPGCAIVQTSDGSALARNYGTSVATPFVTFTAALLRSLGLENPREIKNRIIAAARYVPRLNGLVLSAGTLDPIKAVSLYEDVIEKPGREFVVGRWVRGSFVKLCADKDEFDASRVKKITVLPGTEPALRILYQNDDRRLVPFLCKPEGVGLKIVSAGTEQSFSWAEMRDVVPGLRLAQASGPQ